jgi:cytochrome c5
MKWPIPAIIPAHIFVFSPRVPEEDMSDPHHHHDPIQDNIDTHPVKLAIGVVIGAIALIVGIVLVVQFAIGAHGSRSLKDEPAMSNAEVAKRLAPVAKVVIDPNAPAPAPAATPVAIPAAPGKTASAGSAGKSTYDAVCAVCHATGVANAPKFGDKAAWAPHLQGGMPHLYTSALKGKGAMPAKGGNPALSDDAVKAAVDYMLAAAK